MKLLNFIKQFYVWPFIIALAAFFICSAFTDDKPEAGASCDKALEKITKYYTKFSTADKMYCKYSVQNIENGETGEKLVTEIWVQGSKMKYVNLFITVIQDESTQVLIMKDSKTIILRNTQRVKDSTVIDNGISQFIRTENLKKLGALVNCAKAEGMEKLIIDFPKRSGKFINSLKQLTVEYKPKGDVKKLSYNYYMSKGSKTELYEYLALTEKFDAGILAGKPSGQVFSGNKLNKEYLGYRVQDLRGKHY